MPPDPRPIPTLDANNPNSVEEGVWWGSHFVRYGVKTIPASYYGEVTYETYEECFPNAKTTNDGVAKLLAVLMAFAILMGVIVLTHV